MEFPGLELREFKESYKNCFIVKVCADSNDADYVYETTQIPENKIQEWLPAIKVIYEGKVNGWGEIRYDEYYLTPEFSKDIEAMLKVLIPYDECGVHSVYLESFIYYNENSKAFKCIIKN